MKLKGTVKSVVSYGVFISLDNSQLVGMAHISEISDKFIKDLTAIYATGDSVKAVVLKTDLTVGYLLAGQRGCCWQCLTRSATELSRYSTLALGGAEEENLPRPKALILWC